MMEQKRTPTNERILPPPCPFLSLSFLSWVGQSGTPTQGLHPPPKTEPDLLPGAAFSHPTGHRKDPDNHVFPPLDSPLLPTSLSSSSRSKLAF